MIHSKKIRRILALLIIVHQIITNVYIYKGGISELYHKKNCIYTSKFQGRINKNLYQIISCLFAFYEVSSGSKKKNVQKSKLFDSYNIYIIISVIYIIKFFYSLVDSNNFFWRIIVLSVRLKSLKISIKNVHQIL